MIGILVEIIFKVSLMLFYPMIGMALTIFGIGLRREETMHRLIKNNRDNRCIYEDPVTHPYTEMSWDEWVHEGHIFQQFYLKMVKHTITRVDGKTTGIFNISYRDWCRKMYKRNRNFKRRCTRAVVNEMM